MDRLRIGHHFNFPNFILMKSPVVHFKTLKFKSEGLYKEKGSKFMAFAFPILNEVEVQKALDEVKSLHPKARHFCYAYRLGPDGSAFRQNDDGEPSGTAGKPIHGQLMSFKLTNTLIVVIRYFGGTKLGASGLITAYRSAAEDALNQAKIISRSIQQLYSLEMDYKRLPMMMEAIKNADVTMVNKQFEASAKLELAIPLDKVVSKWNQIATLFVGHDANKEVLIKEQEIMIQELQTRAV